MKPPSASYRHRLCASLSPLKHSPFSSKSCAIDGKGALAHDGTLIWLELRRGISMPSARCGRWGCRFFFTGCKSPGGRCRSPHGRQPVRVPSGLLYTRFLTEGPLPRKYESGTPKGTLIARQSLVSMGQESMIRCLGWSGARFLPCWQTCPVPGQRRLTAPQGCGFFTFGKNQGREYDDARVHFQACQ